MDKLGFTWYPKDWWTSSTFFKLPPELRYLYMEILSILYMNDGLWEANRNEITKRFGVDPGDKGWELLESLFYVEGKTWTHPSVNKRLRKALTSKENGKKGGRPKTQETQLVNLKKPALEREREIETKKKYKSLRDDFWDDGANAFESIKADDMAMEAFQRQLSGMGFKTASIIHVLAALRDFLNKQAVDPDYYTKSGRSEIKRHFSNWLNKQDLNRIIQLTKNLNG